MASFVIKDASLKIKKKKEKTLTTRFDLQTMVEFSVAVELLGARSINALIHQMVHQKIKEAKNLTSAEQFEKMVENQKKETLSRSEKKSNEHLARVSVP